MNLDTQIEGIKNRSHEGGWNPAKTILEFDYLKRTLDFESDTLELDVKRIDDFKSCYTRDKICELADIVKGSTTNNEDVTLSSLDPKEEFMLLFREYFANDSSLSNSFSEIIRFAEEKNISYESLVAIAELQPDVVQVFGETKSEYNLRVKRELLIQWICYASIYELAQFPPLSEEVMARFPQGLQEYYQGFEESTLENVENWNIRTGPGMISGEFNERLIITPSGAGTWAKAAYGISEDRFKTPEHYPIPSLYDFEDRGVIVHELFHSYQDDQRQTLTDSFAELHAHLVEKVSQLRLSRNQFGNDDYFERALEASSQMSLQRATTIRDLMLEVDRGERDKEEAYAIIALMENARKTDFDKKWVWAQAILEGVEDPEKLIEWERGEIKEYASVAANDHMETEYARLDRFVASNFIPKIEEILSSPNSDSNLSSYFQGLLQAADLQLEEVCAYFSIGPPLSNKQKHAEMRVIMQKIRDKYKIDPGLLGDKDVSDMDVVRNYIRSVKLRSSVLHLKAAAYRNSPNARVLQREADEYDKEVLAQIDPEYLFFTNYVTHDGVGTYKSQGDELYRIAYEYFENGDYLSARKVLERGITYDPISPKFRDLLKEME